MGQFSTTNWSVVLAAGEGTTGPACEALEILCERYWYPLYSYARRTKYSPHAAADATQGFFLHVVRSSLVAKADPKRGRFRTFLLEAFRRFLISEFRGVHAAKRGSGLPVLSLDETKAESRFSLEPKDERSPDRLFERSWALNILENAFDVLRNEYEEAGRAHVLRRLEPHISKQEDAEDYRSIALELRMTESAVKVTVHRARKRFREILRGLVAGTVADPLDVDGELRHLVDVLSNGAA